MFEKVIIRLLAFGSLLNHVALRLARTAPPNWNPEILIASEKESLGN